MTEHDALILPSLYEGLPNVVCEALACGLPVLASKISDNPRLVQDAVTGYLFDPNSPDEIAKTIFGFAQLGFEDRLEMSMAARRFAELNLSIHKCVTDLLELI
jgi:glycosyltransferase involved in cell wall biosynthesis